MPFIVQNTIKPWALFLSQRPINYENYTCPRPWTYCFIKVPMNKLKALKNFFSAFIWHTPLAQSCLPGFFWLVHKCSLESWAHFKLQVQQAGGAGWGAAGVVWGLLARWQSGQGVLVVCGQSWGTPTPTSDHSLWDEHLGFCPHRGLCGYGCSERFKVLLFPHI